MTDAGPEPGQDRGGDRLGSATLVAALALVVVVAGVGAVAVGAELLNTWGHYFLMERTITAATPVAGALLGLVVLGGLATAIRAR
ncbi:hypothetical protein ACFQE8_07510 [Salinirubellus sp. GCM10025818]|uniref:hypothetical protein n=1 Tax=Salinirubellus TaxID=2162630 RepID=UPI0030D4F609